MNTIVTKEAWGQLSTAKKIGIVLIALFGFAIIFSVLKMSLFGLSSSITGVSTGDMMQNPLEEKGFSRNEEYVVSNTYKSDSNNSRMADTAPSAPAYNNSGYATGNDAEQYESVSYDVQYKNGAIEKTCDTIESWKPLKFVVFESASRNDVTCQYRLKVGRAHVATILAEVEKLDPEEFTANTETMKKQLVEYSDQLSILLRKQEILEKTLEDAMIAYDDITALATRVENVESLTSIITNKINDISRLTNERIALSQQIEYLSRRSGELNDRIDYVYFSVNVQKYDIFDFEGLTDSWVYKIRQFVFSLNDTLQNLTIGILSLFLTLLQGILYIGIVVGVIAVVGKYGWRILKTFWTK